MKEKTTLILICKHSNEKVELVVFYFFILCFYFMFYFMFSL